MIYKKGSNPLSFLHLSGIYSVYSNREYDIFLSIKTLVRLVFENNYRKEAYTNY